MKTKRFIFTLFIIISVFVFSGCANVTYTVKLKDEGKADVNLSVLYNSKEFSYDFEKIEEIKEKYEDADFDIKEITDKGLSGFQLVRKNIKLNDKLEIDDELKIDILDDLLSSTDFEKGFFGNKYTIDADIDLSSYINLNLVNENINIEVPEDYKKLLSEMNLKLIVELERGAVTSSNSTIDSGDKKVAQWVLIPGANNKIELEAATTDKITVVGTIIVLSVVITIALIIFLVLLKMYIKKRNNK